MGEAIVRMLAMLREKDTASRAPQRGQRGRKRSDYSERNFYAYCGRLEAERNEERTAFPEKGTEEAERNAIRAILRVGPNASEEPIIAIALDLPEDFFRQSFTSSDNCVAAAQAYWNAGSTRPIRRPRKFLRIDGTDHNPPYRKDDFKVLAQFAQFGQYADPAVLALQGQTSIGKSYLVSQWLWSEGIGQFDVAVAVDCQNFSFDQVADSIRSSFQHSLRGDRRLLFLDGLRLEREGSALLFRIPGGQRAAFAELFEILKTAWLELGSFAVIVGVENNASPIVRQDLLNVLPLNAPVLVHRVEALSPDDAAQFLYDRGVNRISLGDRLRVARHYGGLPTFLAAVAREINQMASVAEREAFVAQLFGERMPSAVTKPLQFLDEWLQRHEEQCVGGMPGRVRRAAHPKAFLRLLALMSGPISIGELREIARRVKIERISDHDIESAQLRGLPFVNEVENDVYILHPAAKQYFRDDIAKALEAQDPDPFCSREELEAIHWRAAHTRLRALRNSIEANPGRVRLIEAFVYHVCEQIALIPNEATNSRRSRTRASQPLTPANWTEFDHAPGLLTSGKLWQVAFHEVDRLLLEPKKTATRVYGQFEAKARILKKLFDTALGEGISVAKVTVDIQAEMAICWMHAGRLELALQALKAYGTVRLKGKVDETHWRYRTDRVNIEATVRLRRGDLETLKDLLAPFLEEATSKALLAKPDGPEIIPMDQRGAVKVLSRAAELAVVSGQTAQGLLYFAQVARTLACYKPSFLNGLAARAYVIMLVRQGKHTPAVIAEASALVQQNIEYLNRYRADPDDPMSNEEIGFRVLEAALDRIGGNVNIAGVRMGALSRERAVRRRETNFPIQAEFDLELARIEIAIQREAQRADDEPPVKTPSRRRPKALDVRSDLCNRIERLALRMEDHGHRLLQIDALLLLCELLEGEARFDVARRLRCPVGVNFDGR
ncbi:MAG TPA: hypothetical protein PK823_09510 [Novosphingobium sp.]|nr:hypothetical protein [Novosphingobium sp.]